MFPTALTLYFYFLSLHIAYKDEDAKNNHHDDTGPSSHNAGSDAIARRKHTHGPITILPAPYKHQEPGARWTCDVLFS